MRKNPFARVHRSTSGRRPAAVVLVAVCAACAGYAPLAAAAKIYRCGNVFQDQPCPDPKTPEQRPAERPAASRNIAPCGSAAKDGGGRDCTVRTTPRETQTAAADAKR